MRDIEHVTDLTSRIYGQTVIHPAALVFTLLAGVLIVALPRRHALIPFVVAGIFIPLQQRIVIGPFDIWMLRFLILFGWVRLVARSELVRFQLNSIDKVVILWALSRTVTYTVLHATSAALVNRLGLAFDAIGIYFLARYFVRSFEDMNRLFQTLLVVCLVLGGLMLIEQLSGRNLFSVFGGVPGQTIVRHGRMRSQGAFAHPILAGTFGASLLPFFLAMWRQSQTGRRLALLGAAAVAAVVLASSSSGPVITMAAATTAWMFWPLRRYLRHVRWVLALSLVALHIYMTAPVWALMWRATVFVGSTGYHRYRLFDRFVRNFDEWWLMGVKSTARWGYYLFDITNHYVLMGVGGGLITLVLFVLIIVLCFRGVGQSLRALAPHPKAQPLVWALGASLFAHSVSFMGVSYSDQIVLLWYLTLGMIASATSLSLALKRKRLAQEAARTEVLGDASSAPPPWSRPQLS